MNLTPVAAATDIILENAIDFGIETIDFEQSLGRILAQPLVADRDFPPFDRVTMDGIAIDYQKFNNGQRQFSVASMQAAGETRQTLLNPENCIEVMTGSQMPVGVDTVVRYEDISIENGVATILADDIRPQQNVHFQGQDRLRGDVIVSENTRLSPAEIAIAATVGATTLTVQKLPKVLIITSGDELVTVSEKPLPHQIRSSNVYCVASLLKNYGIVASATHIADDLELTKKTLQQSLHDYDVLILCGGVSKGKKDFIPLALSEIGVEKKFYRVSQQPGKPFWFGRSGNKVVFALPGNPVSTLVCARRYFVPWLHKSLKMNVFDNQFAAIDQDFVYKPDLTYFLQVKLYQQGATLMATPMIGNGSGDFANFVDTQAFMELPQGQSEFHAGEVFPIWRFD